MWPGETHRASTVVLFCPFSHDHTQTHGITPEMRIGPDLATHLPFQLQGAIAATGYSSFGRTCHTTEGIHSSALHSTLLLPSPFIFWAEIGPAEPRQGPRKTINCSILVQSSKERLMRVPPPLTPLPEKLSHLPATTPNTYPPPYIPFYSAALTSLPTKTHPLPNPFPLQHRFSRGQNPPVPSRG